MKKIFTILILFTINVFAFGQFGKTGGGKISVKEVDGSPAGSNIDTIKVNNGSLTITDNVATINITAASASSADSVGREDGTIDGDSLMTKTRTDTVSGAKVFTGDVTLPTNSIGSLQIAADAVDSTHLKPNSIHESEMNWAKQNIDSVTSRVKASRIDSSYNFLTFVATNGDTNSIRAKTDGTLNLYATKGIGLRIPKSDATYPFLVTCEANGGVGDSTGISMNSTGQVGIKGAPNASYSFYSNTGDVYINNGRLGIKSSTWSTSNGAIAVGGNITIDDGYFIKIGSDQYIEDKGVYLSISATDAVRFGANSANSTFESFFLFTGGSFTGTNLEQTYVKVTPTINQSSTAGYNAIYANVTETATGSGAKNLFKGAIGGTEKFRVENSGDVVLQGNLQVQSDSTTHDIFVGNETFSYMDAGADWTTSSSADLKQDFKEIAKPNLEALKLYTFRWKKEGFGWVDLATIPDSVNTFSWSVDTLENGDLDSTQIYYKIPNPKKAEQAKINTKAESREKPIQYGMKSADWNSAMGRQDDGKINWREVAIEFYRLVLDHETKIKDLEARVSKLEGK